MNNFITRNFKGDSIVWMVFILLCIVSVIEMFSSSSFLISRSGSITAPILRHVSFLIGGAIALVITMLVPFKFIRMLGYAGLLMSWVLLLYTLFFGVEQAGAARFLNIAGFQFQPSELAKLSLLIVIADFTDRSQDDNFQRKAFPIYAVGVIITCGLIFPENLSTAMILFIVSMLMMFIGAVKFKRILLLGTIIFAAVALVIGIATIIPESTYRESDNKVLGLFERAYTWVARIDNFFGEDSSPEAKFKITDSNRQVAHAQMAVASGGVFGVMPGNSVQRNFLPEAYSDFIFSIIIEELGLLGGLFVIFLYLWLLFRAGVVARNSTSLFCAILVIGVTLMVVFQAFIHTGVAVHLGPVTGQPLPLISRGGTSVLINCVYFGIILSATHQINKERDLQDVQANESISNLSEQDNNETEEQNIVFEEEN